MDFFIVPTATFRILYVWFAIRHRRRQIVNWNITEKPTPAWVIQQLREAFPFDAAANWAHYLLFDRDSIFSEEVVATVLSMAIDPKRTSFRSPWQKGYASYCSSFEGFAASLRQRFISSIPFHFLRMGASAPGGAKSCSPLSLYT